MGRGTKELKPSLPLFRFFEVSELGNSEQILHIYVSYIYVCVCMHVYKYITYILYIVLIYWDYTSYI